MHPTPPRRLSGALLAATGCCLLALPGASAQGSPAPPPPAKINCMPGVHVIVARASEEAPGPGFLRKVAEDVVSKIPGSDFVSVDYPAKLSDYKASQKAGLVAMSALINDYTAACPDGKVVLMGYSQGAHIAADIVCGASEETFDQASAISDDKSSKIAAVVMMGDPSRNATAPFNQGNATKDGVFPRKNIAGCGAMASRMVSYCSAGDMFCDSGNDLGIHLTYADTQGTAATQFVLDRVKNTQGVSPAPRGIRIRGRVVSRQAPPAPGAPPAAGPPAPGAPPAAAPPPPAPGAPAAGPPLPGAPPVAGPPQPGPAPGPGPGAAGPPAPAPAAGGPPPPGAAPAAGAPQPGAPPAAGPPPPGPAPPGPAAPGPPPGPPAPGTAPPSPGAAPSPPPAGAPPPPAGGAPAAPPAATPPPAAAPAPGGSAPPAGTPSGAGNSTGPSIPPSNGVPQAAAPGAGDALPSDEDP